MLDAEVLLRFILGKDRTWVITHAKEPLDEEKHRLFEEVVNRRAKREPRQYITRKQEFWGVEFIVTPDVLIPRPQPPQLLEAIRKFRPTFAALVPTMYIGMINHPDIKKTDMSCMRSSCPPPSSRSSTTPISAAAWPRSR